MAKIASLIGNNQAIIGLLKISLVRKNCSCNQHELAGKYSPIAKLLFTTFGDDRNYAIL